MKDIYHMDLLNIFLKSTLGRGLECMKVEKYNHRFSVLKHKLQVVANAVFCYNIAENISVKFVFQPK